MNWIKTLVSLTIANFAVMYIANWLGTGYVVFGNAFASPLQAMLTAAIGLAVVVAMVDPVGKYLKIEAEMNVWFLIYLLVNTLTIYLFARTDLSETVGMGIAAYWVAIVLGLFVNLAQYFAWKLTSGEAAVKQK